LSQPSDAAAEVERAPAPWYHAQAVQRVEDGLDVSLTTLEELFLVPAAILAPGIVEDRPERIGLAE
jgi:hypothetical protein